MTYKIIFDTKEYADYDGYVHKATHKEYDIPYERWEEVWYCYKKRKKYVVRESKISGIWATNIVGVTLDNDWHISEDEFYRLFKNKNEAVDWCLKQNQRGTVKVYKRY